jgi:hypothetical protein
MDIFPEKEASCRERPLEVIRAHRSKKQAAKSTRLAFQTDEVNLLILLSTEATYPTLTVFKALHLLASCISNASVFSGTAN